MQFSGVSQHSQCVRVSLWYHIHQVTSRERERARATETPIPSGCVYVSTMCCACEGGWSQRVRQQ